SRCSSSLGPDGTTSSDFWSEPPLWSAFRSPEPDPSPPDSESDRQEEPKEESLSERSRIPRPGPEESELLAAGVTGEPPGLASGIGPESLMPTGEAAAPVTEEMTGPELGPVAAGPAVGVGPDGGPDDGAWLERGTPRPETGTSQGSRAGPEDPWPCPPDWLSSLRSKPLPSKAFTGPGLPPERSAFEPSLSSPPDSSSEDLRRAGGANASKLSPMARFWSPGGSKGPGWSKGAWSNGPWSKGPG